jgi:hypothetical protein
MTNETIHPEIQPGTFWRTPDGGVREITFRDDPLICFREHDWDGSMFAATRGPNASIWDKCTQVADADGTPLEPESAGAYRPFPGTTCLINVPYEYDDCGKYLYHEARVLWCDNMFVAHQQKGGEPAVHKWDEVRCKPLNSTPLKPEGPELISLPIHRQEREIMPTVRVDGEHYAAYLDKRVQIDTGDSCRIVGFRTDGKAVIDGETVVASLWYSLDGDVVFATHAVLKKETDQ